jgi:hypothetical protein
MHICRRRRDKESFVWTASGSCIEFGLPAACITLDLEYDYATDEFHSMNGIPRLAQFCKSMAIPLTVFIEGRVLESHSKVLFQFPSATEFGLHCFDHRKLPDTPTSLTSGSNLFASVLGYAPRAYRAGKYIVTRELINALETNRFVWDTSCLPSVGGAMSSGAPIDRPFRLPNGLWELPVAVWPRLRIPLTMSCLSMMGLFVARMLVKSCGLPNPLVFVVHLHDIFPSPALGSATFIRKLGHRWNYRIGLVDPFERFVNFMWLLKLHNYRFLTGSQLIEEIRCRAKSDS